MSLPHPPSRRVTAALVGCALLAGGLLSSGSAGAAEAPHIVILDPDADLRAQVRDEQRRGNDVDAVIRTIGKGFVADLDRSDVARLEADPRVLHVEPDQPVRLARGATAPQAGMAADAPAPGTKSQAVGNDPFSGAQEITGATGSVSGTTVGASRETGEPGHGGSGGRASVWYRWTAPSSGTLRVTTQGSTFDTLLGAYSGTTVNRLTTLADNDDTGTERWSSITFTVAAGTTYHLAVDGYGGWTGASVLNWSLSGSAPAPPTVANDMFSDATVISGATGEIRGSTSGAKRESGEPVHGDASGRASIWYQWTAPSSGTLRVSTEGSAFDTLLAGYSGASINALTQLDANDDNGAGGLWSRITIPVAQGTTYRIAVDGWGGYSGATVLSWAMEAPAADPAPSPSPTPAPSPGPVSRTAASWGLDRIDQAALPLNGTISTSQNGSGVTAYVIDTGVRPDHADFGGRVTSGFTSITDGNGADDCNGHGTHVAGTVAGTAYGVAPAATIVPVRVLSCSGSGSTSGVIAGIDWAVRHHQAGTPAVANMSLGGGYSAALNAAVAAGVADGITFAVAAGNSDADACNASPASEPSALTVGSTTSSDARSSFSNWGSCLDVFAPGSGIRSAYHTSPTATATLSGTSMAAPHVAGAAALLLAATPSATPSGVSTAMVQGATRGVVSDPKSAANLLLNVSSGVAPAPADAPARETTPANAPLPVPAAERPGAGGTAGAPPRPRTVSRTPAPRLVAATRTGTGVKLRISGRGAAYRVVINGRVVARTTSRTPVIRTTAARKAATRGARVRVQAVGAAGVSPLSNIIRL
jgi:hypothetical protein